MSGRDPQALLDEIRPLSRAIGRLVRRRKAGLLWCGFDDVELKRLQDERSRLQTQLPPLRLVVNAAAPAASPIEPVEIQST